MRETAEKQTSEKSKKQLLDQLNELMDLINALSKASKNDDFVSIIFFLGDCYTSLYTKETTF